LELPGFSDSKSSTLSSNNTNPVKHTAPDITGLSQQGSSREGMTDPSIIVASNSSHHHHNSSNNQHSGSSPSQRQPRFVQDFPWRLWYFCQEHQIGLLLFCIGVWNNAPYVIMLASAKDVSEGGVALVYIANILPGLFVKASGSYWFDKVSYAHRLYAAAVCMGLAFTLVSFFSSHRQHDGITAGGVHWVTLAGELCGIALISAQCSLGEASMLAWAGGKIGDHALTWFASGTGLAGPIGFLYHFVCVEIVGWSLSTTCALAVFLWAAVYWVLTQTCLRKGETCSVNVVPTMDEPSIRIANDGGSCVDTQMIPDVTPESEVTLNEAHQLIQNDDDNALDVGSPPLLHASVLERLKLTLSLWPYMIPLFTVYAAEYACQGGAWTAMGFPVESVSARKAFYTRANWLYQIGVFFSRSSGTLFMISRFMLWVLPSLQVLNLVFFYWTAQMLPAPFWYNPVVTYGTAFWTGLLGGAVYVHGYRRVIADIAPVHREFALSTVSLAESLGVLCADVLGLFLQACLYQVHHLEGAVVQCPV